MVVGVGDPRAAAGGRHRAGRHLAGRQVRFRRGRARESTEVAPVSRTVAVLVGVAAGCLVGIQAPVNSRLGRVVGTLPAASFSFLVGTAALLTITSIVGGGLARSAASGEPLVGARGGAAGRGLRVGGAGRGADLGSGRADGRGDHRPARGVGGDRPLRPAGRGQAAGQPHSRCSACCCSWPGWCWSCVSSGGATARRRSPRARRGWAGLQSRRSRAARRSVAPWAGVMLAVP